MDWRSWGASWITCVAFMRVFSSPWRNKVTSSYLITEFSENSPIPTCISPPIPTTMLSSLLHRTTAVGNWDILHHELELLKITLRLNAFVIWEAVNCCVLITWTGRVVCAWAPHKSLLFFSWKFPCGDVASWNSPCHPLSSFVAWLPSYPSYFPFFSLHWCHLIL